MTSDDVSNAPATVMASNGGAGRQARVATRPNPNPGLDYLVTHEGELTVDGPPGRTALVLRYVPDRLVLAPQAFEDYLRALSGEKWTSLESFSAAVLEDLGNELVARWLNVATSTRSARDEPRSTHRVTLDDRQPAWDNPALLARIELY